MRMRATDTFHTSATRTVAAGAEFDIHDEMAKDLERAGLAVPVGASAKAEPAPDNKMIPAPDNGAIPAPVNKRGPGRPKKPVEPVDLAEPEDEEEAE